MSERELRFGLGFLKANLRRTSLPMVCANLRESQGGKLLLAPYVVKTVGTVKVGIFGLMSQTVELGPARDSLVVDEPSAVAKRTVAELRRKGATVVVLLSQLGKVESEDLVGAVTGIDVLIVGHNVPLLQKGRMIGNTVACYGGEQGQYIGRTLVTLDRAKRMTTGENEDFMLGPDIPDKKEIAALVKGFMTGFNEKFQRQQKERVAQEAEKVAQGTPEHYLGGEVCARCHASEAAQWATTKHARAWQTLVDAKKDTTAECLGCHVVGYRQPGGYTNQAATPNVANVQCESCHGMGSQHDAFRTTPRRVTEQTCRTCHTRQWSPGFDFALYEPYVNHRGAGTKRPLPGSPQGQQQPVGGK